MNGGNPARPGQSWNQSRRKLAAHQGGPTPIGSARESPNSSGSAIGWCRKSGWVPLIAPATRSISSLFNAW